MKFARVSVGALCAALLLTPPSLAWWQAIQSRDAARELFVVDGAHGPEIRDGGASVRLEPPRGVILQRLEALGDGWIVAGSRRADGETSLWLATGGDGAPETMTPPPIGDRYLSAPMPLIEQGGLVGLAWLEGERHDAMAVRAAAWSGRRWDDPVTVSPPDLESQLALAGAVLPDGSWQLVWSAVDGSDDEIYSARRGVDGAWEARRQLNPANDVPDIHPQIVATAEGSLIAWNELHDGHYRVRLIHQDLRGRERVGHVAAPGTVSPRLLTSGGFGLLLYKDVLAERWTALEVDAGGTPLRMALAEISNRPPPVVVSSGEALTFRWADISAEGPPAAAVAETSELEVPWQPFELESLDDRPDSPSAAGGTDGTPPRFGAGTVIYRAFGDSVSRGHALEFFPTIVFDKVEPGEGGTAGPACVVSDPFSVLCGYNWRLENLIAGSDVANDGYPGETTTGGVSRVDGVLAGAGDVLLVMEGSNDLTFCGTSTTTVRDNIGTMVDKATAAGFDSVIASVAKRRRLDENSIVVADPCGEDGLNLDLRNKLSALATSKNRAFADVYDSIDPNLWWTDYWNGCGAAGETCMNPDVVGHPDSSGYDKIAPKFSAAILADSMLGPPTPIGPSGNVTSNLTFSWNELAGARLYRLSVTGPGAPPASWYDSLAICAASVCSVNLGQFGAGSYSWMVAGKNLRGLGSYSGALAFDVFTAPPAGAPATGEPVGACPDCYDSSPPVLLSFEFNQIANATAFELELSDSGGVISTESFAAATICTGGSCSAPSATGLGGGDYLWRVRGKNPAGSGPWSSLTAFSIYTSVPGLATLIGPSGERFDDTPTYRWFGVGGATGYRLEVKNQAGFPQDYSANSICTGSCAVEPPNVLPPGVHEWRVRAENPLGVGAFTAYQPFEVLDCTAFPADVEVDGSNTGSAVYRACPGTVTSKAGFVIASGEVVTLHGKAAVVIEEIQIQSGATATFLSN